MKVAILHVELVPDRVNLSVRVAEHHFFNMEIVAIHVNRVRLLQVRVACYQIRIANLH